MYYSVNGSVEREVAAHSRHINHKVFHTCFKDFDLHTLLVIIYLFQI